MPICSYSYECLNTAYVLLILTILMHLSVMSLCNSWSGPLYHKAQESQICVLAGKKTECDRNMCDQTKLSSVGESSSFCRLSYTQKQTGKIKV